MSSQVHVTHMESGHVEIDATALGPDGTVRAPEGICHQHLFDRAGHERGPQSQELATREAAIVELLARIEGQSHE